MITSSPLPRALPRVAEGLGTQRSPSCLRSFSKTSPSCNLVYSCLLSVSNSLHNNDAKILERIVVLDASCFGSLKGMSLGLLHVRESLVYAVPKPFVLANLKYTAARVSPCKRLRTVDNSKVAVLSFLLTLWTPGPPPF